MSVCLVTGAYGLLGQAVVEVLTKEAKQMKVRILERNPTKIEKVKQRFSGVESAIVDLTKVESIEKAMQGVTQAVLILGGPNRDVQGRNFIDVAKRHNVQHIVLQSIVEAKARQTKLQKEFADVEVYLDQSGLSYTVMQIAVYSATVTMWHADQVAQGQLMLPIGNGRMPLTDPLDGGAFFGRVCANQQQFKSKVQPVVSDLLSGQEMAQAISEAIGKPVQFKPANAGEAVNHLVKNGWKPDQAQNMVELMEWFGSGKGQIKSDAAQLGITLHSFRDHLKDPKVKEHLLSGKVEKAT